MKKRVFAIAVLVILILPIIIASSIDNQIQKLTHYAEEYETGNIDYVKLMIYTGGVREKLNQELGAVSQEHGGLLKQEQIRKMLGEPTEETKWVWNPRTESDRKVLEPVPFWRKIVFDGRKIQIRLEAFPMIFVKGKFGKDREDYDYGYEEEKIVYSLHFDIQFKKPEEQIDINSKIEGIKSLAEAYNSNPSSENAETLAKESVNIERAFEDSYRESGGECVDIMNSIFGSEFKKETQKLLVQEISFYDGDNFEAIIRLEMCDDCDWNWINLDFRIESRGPGFHYPDMRDDDYGDNYEGMGMNYYESETRNIIESIRRSLEEGNIEQAHSYKNKLWKITEAWNRKSNDVWDEVKQDVEFDSEKGVDDPYFWIKEDQRQREKVKVIQKKNFEDRKRFYSELFSGLDRREYYYEQQGWEKRLIEEFKEKGEEICNNNQDDNENEQVDCEDEQCLGKICGKQSVERVIGDNNETQVIEVDLYCIAGQCQQKEEIVDEGAVCGNNICEESEDICSPSAVECDEDETECSATMDCGIVYCPEDCVQCPEHEAIECPEGEKVIFSGNGENGCPLEPICFKEKSCFSNDDCEFRCGIGECVFENEAVETGVCELVELKECGSSQCADGEKTIEKCENGMK